MLYMKLWDVKYGNSTYIKTPNGKNIVQDLGIGEIKSGSITFSPLLSLKNEMKIDKLDEVIITHPHTDHIKDIFNFDLFTPQALNRPRGLTTEKIFAANRSEDHKLVKKYIEISSRYNEDISGKESPLHTKNNGGASIQVFQPTDRMGSNINNDGIVTVISYATSKVVLPGDNDAESWQELLRQDSFKEAIKDTDIFVASHHGLRSGFCYELFNNFHPKLVIVSNGKYNDDTCLALYGKLASGLNVHTRNGGIVEKKCVTTNRDGNIEIAMGWIVGGQKSFLSVTAD
jgi:beta-lactamase superfamily II metal-dependent hydrolase